MSDLSKLTLAAARDALSAEEAATLEAQRQTELLNQQVAALRDQLGGLQALLDDAREREQQTGRRAGAQFRG